MIGKCRLCRKEKPLIEAHILARSILEVLQSTAGSLMSISKDVESHPKRLPTGSYDKEILCADCDGIFSPWENYTAELLYKVAGKYRAKGTTWFYFIPDYDYVKLKLCVLSILWRMSISNRPEFRNVTLSPEHENELRELILAKDPGPPDRFSVAWMQLSDHIGTRSVLGTSRSVQTQQKIYNLGLPGFIAIIKVGIDHIRHPFQGVIMAPDKPLFVGLKENRLEDDWKPTFHKLWKKEQKKKRR